MEASVITFSWMDDRMRREKVRFGTVSHHRRLGGRRTDPTSKSEWKKSCGDDLLQQTTNKDRRQTKRGIDCVLTYTWAAQVSAQQHHWELITPYVSQWALYVYVFIYNRETSKAWTKIPFNSYLSSIINCAFLIPWFSWCLQQDVPFELCLSQRLCHPKLRDSFNCNTTTTRNTQNPHKSIEKLAAFPMRPANHGVITGKRPLHLRLLYGEGDFSIFYVWSKHGALRTAWMLTAGL